MEQPNRGIIGPFPPIWKMQARDIPNLKDPPDPVKIKTYEKIITLFSDFHNKCDKLRDKLAMDIEKIIRDLEENPRP